MARRFAEIDVLKVAGIAAVVLVHSIRPQWHPLISPVETWLGHVTRFCVPSFLFASGYLYASREPVSAQLTWRRLRRIAVPYLAVSLLAQVWPLPLDEYASTGSLWRDLLFGASLGPYYYVFVIAILVIVTPGFARLAAPLRLALTAVMIALQWWVDAAIGLDTDPFWHLRSPLLWWAYFLVGWESSLRREPITTWVTARRRPLAATLALAVGLLAAASGTDALGLAARSAAWANVYTILALLFVASCGLAATPRWLRSVSDATYAIYLLHLFFVLTAQLYVQPGPLRAELLPILLPWLAGMLGPLVVVEVLRRLLGERSRDLIGA